MSSPRLKESQCKMWITKPAFLHISNAVHIYFKLLDLYNVHKAIYDEKLKGIYDRQPQVNHTDT